MPPQRATGPQNSANRRRVFSDAVSIDAWHDRFDGKRSIVDLHADVVFGVARVGGDTDSPIRFRLSIKRAEVVVVIPDTEPISVNPKSVAREITEPQGQLTEIVEQNAHTRAKAKFSASTSSAIPNVKGSAELEAQGAASARRKLKISSTIRFMTVTTSKTEEGYYRWLIKPSTSATLEGAPWDAVKEPRL